VQHFGSESLIFQQVQAIDLLVQQILGFRQCLEGKEKRENNE